MCPGLSRHLPSRHRVGHFRSRHLVNCGHSASLLKEAFTRAKRLASKKASLTTKQTRFCTLLCHLLYVAPLELLDEHGNAGLQRRDGVTVEVEPVLIRDGGGADQRARGIKNAAGLKNKYRETRRNKKKQAEQGQTERKAHARSMML